jgi:hypothetical protein
VDDLSKQTRKTMNNHPYPDMSHIKPPTESAASNMVKNLRTAAGTKADHSPKNAKLSERFIWHDGDIVITKTANKKPKPHNK